VKQQAQRGVIATRRFIQRCKQRKRDIKIADSISGGLSGGQLLTKTLVLRRLLRRHVLTDDEQFVGVLLPPTQEGVIVNTALSIDRRIVVNLNYTFTSEDMNGCIKTAGIKHVLTSKKFMEKMDLELDAEVVYLEDLKEKPTLGDKLHSAWEAYVKPAGRLEKQLKLDTVQPDDLLTVIFTSGSTGQPKGVMLTYENVGSNVDAISQLFYLTHDDTLIGVLPFFHSFGFTVALWTCMALDVRAAYHVHPLEARQIGKLCGKFKGTVLVVTPTFLRSYVRRCTEEDFATLDAVVTAAEKLPPDLADAFEKKFHVRPVEGYGATETSPLVSVNIPPNRSRSEQNHLDYREGTVGKPVPGVTAKIVDLDTGEELSAGESGMLCIKGPNIMRGYYGREDLTAAVLKDGWYVTGDVGLVDDEGFIRITGRKSRFSKIGGEMVPHIKVEEALNRAAGAEEQDQQLLAVTAVPHPKKGEQLVVLHAKLNQAPGELVAALRQEGLPNLFIPAEDCFFEVHEIPILGTGKLDLKTLKHMAGKLFPK
jgi:acyl-[acyl-carrier-protein]-phospholipid O-acyltransferase/long-chain-fatty-acid--[acyl-carrier-protein] ligase